MAVIVKTDYEDAVKFKGKNIYTQIGKKKHQIFFRIIVDEYSLNDSINLMKEDSNIIMLDYQGNLNNLPSIELDKSIYIGRQFKFGDNITEDDIKFLVDNYPQWLTKIIQVSESFNNMEFIHKMCKKYNDIRFCGGYTFQLEGCRLGCCGQDIFSARNMQLPKNLNLIHSNCACIYQVLPRAEVDILISEKAIRENKKKTLSTKKSSSSKSGTVDNKPSLKNKLKQLFEQEKVIDL